MASRPIDYSYENIGRVPKSAALPSTIALYATALIAAILRGFVRWHYGQLRLLDDGMVVFSVACMTVAFALWIVYINDVYITEALIYAPFQYLGQIDNIVQVAIDIQIFSTSYIIISITGIFAIKFSFLFFFRHLIDRIRKLQIYWKCVAIYTAIVWVISISIASIACPFYDARAVQCAQGPYFRRAFDVSIALIIFDVTTDALIISIPIILIRKIKIPLKSKIYLAIPLCLSLCMIVVAILQGATITRGGVDAIDVVWELYFQFVEVTIAILVVSLTAFRTLFIGHRAKNSAPSSNTPPHKKWYSSDGVRKVWKKMSRSEISTNDTAWSQDIPRSSRPLPSTIQPDCQTSELGRWSDRKLSDRKLSGGRKLSVHENGSKSQPETYGGTTLASHSDPEPFISGTMSGPLTDVPMAVPLPSPPEESNPIEVRSRPARPRSDISTERRISYWQKEIRIGVQKAVAPIMPVRSPTPSSSPPEGRHSPSGESKVSPIGPSPDISPLREQV